MPSLGLGLGLQFPLAAASGSATAVSFILHYNSATTSPVTAADATNLAAGVDGGTFGAWSAVPTSTTAAGSLVTGVRYVIVSPGTTVWTLAGAADSNAGTVFTATGTTVGTGTARKTMVFAAGSNRLHSSFAVGATTYAAGNANNNRLELLDANDFTDVRANFQTGHRKVSLGFFWTAAPPQSDFDLYDICYIGGASTGKFVVFQLSNGTGANFQVNLESSNGSTQHSPYVTVTQGATYWIRVQIDASDTGGANNGVATCQIYETSGWTSIGTITSDAGEVFSNEDLGTFRLGNGENGNGTGTTYIENIVGLYDSLTPLGP